MEFAEDSLEHPRNILEPIAQAIAQNIDSDFINGGGTTEPMGLDNMTGTYFRYHMGVNGAVISDYAPLEALWRKSREQNHDVSAFIMAPRTLGEFKLLETDTEGVQKPNIFPEIPMVETNAVGIADTQGSATNATKIYAGNFARNVVAGWRYGGPDSIKFLVDRSTLAEFGKIRLYGMTRMGLMHNRGYGVFGYVKGVIPSAAQLT